MASLTLKYSCQFLVVSVILTTVSSYTIKNVTSVENKTEPFQYPDWVPFKNKHGDELGEFKPVPKKPRKRLALPTNFVLRAVSDDIGGDDYYEKSMGQSEDNYEFKDWSDTNRPAQINTNATVNHTDISDIDGVVNIIINHNDRAKLAEEINKGVDKSKDISKTDDSESEESGEVTSKPHKKVSGEEETDYDETATEKTKTETEAEQRENEAKKAFILNSVDELKARHSQEARALSEKIKEEEIHKEQLERDKFNPRERERDKYGHTPQAKIEYDDYENKEPIFGDKYQINPLKKKTTTTTTPATTKRRHVTHGVAKKEEQNDGKLSVFKNPGAYMIPDYEENENEKKQDSATTKKPSRHKKNKSAKSSRDDVRIKFVAGDVEGKEEEPTLFFPITHKKGKHKKSSKKSKSKNKKEHEKEYGGSLYKSSSKIMDDSERYNLGPSGTATDTDDSLKISQAQHSSGPANIGEYALTGPSAPEGLSVELVPKETMAPQKVADDIVKDGKDKPAQDSALSAASAPSAVADASADSTRHNKEESALTGVFPPSAIADAAVDSTRHHHKEDSALSAASAPAAVADAAVEGTRHHKEAHKDYHYEKGGEREHASEHHSSMGEHGKKAYEGLHKDTKTKKMHHDKEGHSGSYDDHGGHDRSHHDEKLHHASHLHEEHGNKRAKYEESGKHSKGHSTKGSHDIHKKEEYEKKVEFFEEEGDSAEEEKHGGHSEEKKHSKGGQYKKGHLQSEFDGLTKGEAGHSSRGGQGHGHKAHHSSGGHDAHKKQSSSHSSASGKQGDKKWIYHHGHPAKTANLVVIDRRADQFYHGPQYYGQTVKG